MNKSELITAISEHTDTAQKDVVMVLRALGQEVEMALKNGDNVILPGIGKLSVKQRNGRTGRNPRTGEEIQIAAKNVVNFKATKSLADSIA